MKPHILSDLTLALAPTDHPCTDGGRAGLWIRGHTHDSFDYRSGGSRVVCNPRMRAHEINPDCMAELAAASMWDRHLADVVYKD